MPKRKGKHEPFDDDGLFGSDDSDDPYHESAGATLVDFMLSLYAADKMTARAFCVICYWASRAGAKGPLHKFAQAPDSQPGKFQRKIDQVLKFRKEDRDFPTIIIPKFTKYTLGRQAVATQVLFPHEELDNDIKSDDDFAHTLRRKVDEGHFSEHY